MLLLTIIGLLTGAMLGLRYTVTALIPAILVVACGIAAFGAAIGDGTLSILLTTGAAVAALQFGYLAGAVLRLGLPGGHEAAVSSAQVVAIARRPLR